MPDPKATEGRRLDGETLRILKILDRTPAHEVASQPLRSMPPLITNGLASVVREYMEEMHGKWVRCREIQITRAGRDALATAQK